MVINPEGWPPPVCSAGASGESRLTIKRKDAKRQRPGAAPPQPKEFNRRDRKDRKGGRYSLCTAISGLARRLRRVNAETQRFAEERRERRKKIIFSSALVRALCVSALRPV